jgi:hypothetical protein
MPALDVHEEVKMFVEAGLAPMQAIQAATINVAKTFGKDQDFGTLEAGKVADIVLVEGDPLEDIWATQNVKMVFLAGNLMDIQFHSNHRNPIPSAGPWRLVPKEIQSAPVELPRDPVRPRSPLNLWAVECLTGIKSCWTENSLKRLSSTQANCKL